VGVWSAGGRATEALPRVSDEGTVLEWTVEFIQVVTQSSDVRRKPGVKRGVIGSAAANEQRPTAAAETMTLLPMQRRRTAKNSQKSWICRYTTFAKSQVVCLFI